MKQKPLTNKQERLIAQANGPLSVLAIGINNYSGLSGFPALKTCVNDAIAVRDAFQEVQQLNADKGKIRILTSKTNPALSKGEILEAVKCFINEAEPNSRLLFYYSGHGYRKRGESEKGGFYIVPQDVDGRESLIDFADIVKDVNASKARQRIFVVDACMSGPEFIATEMKKFLAVMYSKYSCAEYIRDTNGVVFISSSTSDQISTTQSPNPKLSLFTYYFVKALRGEPNALDNCILTIDSLYNYISTEVQRRAKAYQRKQSPCINIQAKGTIILGDFR